jgi:hypothetical protein
LKSHLFKLTVFLSSLMMEAARTSETSVDNHFTRQYIPEDSSELHTRRRENLKSQIIQLVPSWHLWSAAPNLAKTATEAGQTFCLLCSPTRKSHGIKSGNLSGHLRHTTSLTPAGPIHNRGRNSHVEVKWLLILEDKFVVIAAENINKHVKGYAWRGFQLKTRVHETSCLKFARNSRMR